MRQHTARLAFVAIALALPALCATPAKLASPQPLDSPFPGLRRDGAVLLPNQWALRPAGKQIALGDFPSQIAIHPGGQFAAILHCGYGEHEIAIVDLTRARVVARAPIPEAFFGLAFTPDGTRLFCSGAGDEVVHSFQFRQGYLADRRELRLRPVNERGIPGGLAVSRDAQLLWVASVWGHTVTALNTETGGRVAAITLGSSAAAPSALPQPPADPDLAAATKRSEALLDPALPTDPYPYACLLDEPRGRLYVSLWAQAAVAVIDLATRRLLDRWPTQEHPNEMALTPDGKTLFVANANRNTISAIDPETGQPLETLCTAPRPDAPAGSTPNSLAISPDGTLLFAANAGINAVVVFDITQPRSSRSLGFIPVGWYPTSVRITPDGRRLIVANGKGQISRPNRHGPQPGRTDTSGVTREYIGGLLRGTLSLIDLPATREQLVDRLKTWTAQAYACWPSPPAAPASPGLSHPIPGRLGDPSPIRYCIYIIKENRTYDQVFGDVDRGNGDPALCLFPEPFTPNHHALAREFVLLDNFYVESEVSADGHEWSMAAYATDYVEKAWPLNYGHNQRGKYAYPAEGRFAVALPSSGYLWDRAREAGVSYRSYGEFATNGRTPNDPATPNLPALVGHIDPGFRGWDMDYLDIHRADRFIAELKRFEQTGDMPRLQILRLPNDHTYGTSTGKRTPRAMVADNDLALGRVVDAVSHSKFWPKTALFVVEDDAQNGPDHVDAHRTVAFVISPYVRRGSVDSTLYSTCSMLRTIELILGLQPMTLFDAAAAPMSRCFQSKPNLRPYAHRPVTIDLDERNTPLAYGADESNRMNFTREDAADDLRLNDIVWRSVRGPEHPAPPPVRAGFVFAPTGSKDADD
jgi:DNA-binding beta-propeller fold protein YncE